MIQYSSERQRCMGTVLCSHTKPLHTAVRSQVQTRCVGDDVVAGEWEGLQLPELLTAQGVPCSPSCKCRDQGFGLQKQGSAGKIHLRNVFAPHSSMSAKSVARFTASSAKQAARSMSGCS